MPDPVPVPLTDVEAAHHQPEFGDWDTDDRFCHGCHGRWPCPTTALCEALRIAVDHEPMPVNDGRDWCSKCQNYMRGDSGCTAADAGAALAAVRELVDLGEKP